MVNKKGLVVETSLNLISILPYHFYLVHVIYYLCLTKTNLFISIPYPNQVYEKQREKKHFSVVICVCCAMSCLETFLSHEWGFPAFYGLYQKNVLSPTILATFGKHFSNFPISIKRQQSFFWLTPVWSTTDRIFHHFGPLLWNLRFLFKLYTFFYNSYKHLSTLYLRSTLRRADLKLWGSPI